VAVLAQEQSHPLPLERLNTQEMITAVSALILWLFLFTGGLIIGTEPYRVALGDAKISLDFASLIRSWFIVVTCYTLTNVALLCCLSSLLGAFGRRAKLVMQDEDDRPCGVGNPYVSAMIRGFFIYLVLLSGVLILLEQPFSNASAEQYLRLAGFISLLSFMVGYNPHLFSRLLARIGELVEGRSQNS
jgi:hypothetical protein